MAFTNHDSCVDLRADRTVDKIRVEDKNLKRRGHATLYHFGFIQLVRFL